MSLMRLSPKARWGQLLMSAFDPLLPLSEFVHSTYCGHSKGEMQSPTMDGN